MWGEGGRMAAASPVLLKVCPLSKGCSSSQLHDDCLQLLCGHLQGAVFVFYSLKMKIHMNILHEITIDCMQSVTHRYFVLAFSLRPF